MWWTCPNVFILMRFYITGHIWLYLIVYNLHIDKMYTFIICELLSSFYFKGPFMQHSTHSVITDGYHLRLISWSLVHRSIYLCSFRVFVNCDLTRYVISYNTQMSSVTKVIITYVNAICLWSFRLYTNQFPFPLSKLYFLDLLGWWTMANYILFVRILSKYNAVSS